MKFCYFAIVARQNDRLLFELESGLPDDLVSEGSGERYDGKKSDKTETPHFVAHAALDVIVGQQGGGMGGAMWSTAQRFLRVVDRYGPWSVVAQIAPGGERLLLVVSDSHNPMTSTEENSCKAFLGDCQDLLIRATINPFHFLDSPINCPIFEARAKTLATRHLGFK
jgi:hypothetical protein